MALLTLSRNDKRLVDLPTSWSNKNRHEQLQKAAAESFSNLAALAVAKSNTNFQLYDALRPLEEQKEIFFDRYRRTNWSAKRNKSDRWYQGKVWRKVKGANAAAPGMSNHGSGLAVDIHPGPIQEILKSDGPAWGWSWAEGRKTGESWHFVYVGGNRYASRGWLDHAWVQKVVGAKVDGKIGTGTVAKIKAYQKEHGLEADGIVGPGTKKVMLGKGEAPAPSAPAQESSSGTDLVIADLPDVESGKASPNKHTDRVDPRDGKSYGVKHITVHWWGTPSGQAFDGIVNHLCNKSAEVSAHYVISSTRVAQIVDEKDSSWANGNRVANFESITIECDPNDVLGTIPVLAALIKDIRGRHGDLPIYPHQHWTSTACPGDYLPHLDAVDKLARTGKAVVAPGRPAPKPAASKVDEDGRFGRETVSEIQARIGSKVDGRICEDGWKRLARKYGTPVDGFVSHQSYKPEELGNGIVPRCWRFTGRGSKGSKLIRAIQKDVGVTQDGILFEGTTKAIQRKLNSDPNFLRR